MKVRKMPYWSGGERRLSEKWYAVFVDHSEILRRLPLFDDRRASESLAKVIDRLNSIRGGSDVITAELARSVEAMPQTIRAKLAKWEILSAAKVAAGKPLAEHLNDWKGSLLSKGGTERHAEKTSGRARRLFNECNFKFWSDLSASKLHAAIADMRIDYRNADGSIERGISAQTSNFYLQAAKQFARWMVQDGRATESPLAHLRGLNVRTDRRHDRRALSADELQWLLDVTAESDERNGMSGEARAMLYRLAVETGLRAGELRSLTRVSFRLDDEEPTVTIAAAYAKNRREDSLPLRANTAAALAAHLAGKMQRAKAFDVPAETAVSKMFRADLDHARRTWINAGETDAEREASGFLLYRDHSNLVADFHALRHTFISNLAAGGVHPKTAQALARHSTITLTMDRYSHIYRGALASALDVLPNLSPVVRQVKKTGSDGMPVTAENRLSPDLSPRCEFRRNSAESCGVERGKGQQVESLGNIERLSTIPSEVLNGSTRIRTWDQGFMRPLL